MDTNAATFLKTPSRDSTTLYDDEADRKKHMAYMASIAEEKHWEIAAVLPYYENILGDLRGHARVHDFLNIFVAKKVFEQLKASKDTGRHA